jgi:L-fucose isomerase-like protein
LKQTTILAVTDDDVSKMAVHVREVFGSKVVRINGANLKQYYDQTSVEEATVWAERWEHGAKRGSKSATPASEALISAARTYLALSRVRSHVHADVVAVDCNTLRKLGGSVSLPCLSHFQMNNDGFTAVCSADLNAACAQALLTHISRKPGVLAKAAKGKSPAEVMLAHSACTNRLMGHQADASPYAVRPGVDGDQAVYVTTSMPRHEPITLVELDVAKRRMSVSSAETLGTQPQSEKCRTCVLAKTRDGLAPLPDGSIGPCVMTFGAYAKRVENLARLLGLQANETTDVA